MRFKATTDFGRAISCAESQEDAADKLNVGLRSLQKYLYNESYPPCTVIAAAAREYGAHWYALKHLTTECPIAKMYLPVIELRDLATSVLMMQKELKDIGGIQGEIVDMACDGQIDKSESSRWQQRISPEIQDAIRVLICTDVVAKAKTACVGAQTALR